MTEEENTYKISVPLISDNEIRQIDNYLDDIVSQFTKQLVHDKDLAIAQHIIQKQQEEIEKKDKIIDLMAKALYVEGYCKELNCSKCTTKNFADCIKQYFESKV